MDLEMNEIRIEEIIDDVNANLDAEFYNIDSANVTTTRILASAQPDTNAFLVTKTAPENIINTMVAFGEYLLTAPSLDTKQSEEDRRLVSVSLKALVK
ncbi:hypothetical protein [Chengkuizengella marina]|uniref:Uncharacterized protein n=1 Tax=Chengkuizengella marina TaxID=2507566 RepID=A0A6N9Q0H7_9BACL|nr:hypothetical protein [Chengkuizengella marina]NBI27464.1 hypothetical protein [Chengkuizengella marina]